MASKVSLVWSIELQIKWNPLLVQRPPANTLSCRHIQSELIAAGFKLLCLRESSIRILMFTIIIILSIYIICNFIAICTK